MKSAPSCVQEESMNLAHSKPSYLSPGFARGRSLIHVECPIEQTLHSEHPETQSQLMQQPWSRDARPDGTLFVADYNGLRLLGRSEGALHAAVEPLRRRFGDRLVVEVPSVRYAFGVPTLEPYMTVLINGPPRNLPAIHRDFLRRRGRLKRLKQRGTFVLEGEAPLADLLGYALWLRDLLKEPPYVGLWLSRYLPIDDDGPQAA
jgi:hypothetical protein